MGKGRIFGSIAILATVAAVVWNGCGSSSNSQGISFRSLGFFADDSGTTADTFRCASLSFDRQVPQDDPRTGGVPQGGFLGLQNSMFQGINVDHVNLSYHVNGASLAIPNDVFALSERLGPATETESSPSTQFSQIVIVSPNIFKFLNDNRSRLPDLPFTMVATATATGTADSSDVFTTNRSTYEINFVNGLCAEATPTPEATATPVPTP